MELRSISIIIPTLNEEKVIERTLSQFPQNFCDQYNIEVIISDGGSKDNTVSLARQSGHSVIAHTSERRQTIAEGRNLGAKQAKGDILVFLDADVIISRKDIFFRFIQVFGISKHVFMTGNVHIHPGEETRIDAFWHHSINFWAFLMQRTKIPTARGELQIIKKEVFENIGGYREDLIAAEDFDLGIRARKKGRLWYNPRITVYESPRRFRKYGYPKVIRLWLKNSISLIFHNKSSSQEWEVVR